MERFQRKNIFHRWEYFGSALVCAKFGNAGPQPATKAAGLEPEERSTEHLGRRVDLASRLERPLSAVGNVRSGVGNNSNV